VVWDAVKGYLQLASGLTEVTRARATAAAKALVSQGEATADQVSSLAQDLLATSRANQQAVAAIARREVERAMTQVGARGIESASLLSARVKELEGLVRGLLAGAPPRRSPGRPGLRSTGAPSAASPPARPAATKAAAPAKKTATKKTATKKTATKKTGTKKTGTKKTGTKKTGTKKTGTKKTGTKRTTPTTTKRPTSARTAPTAQRRGRGGGEDVVMGSGEEAENAASPGPQPDPGVTLPWVEPVRTGEPAVDRALDRLAELDERPVGEHVEVYDEVHQLLQDALSDLDGA